MALHVLCVCVCVCVCVCIYIRDRISCWSSPETHKKTSIVNNSVGNKRTPISYKIESHMMTPSYTQTDDVDVGYKTLSKNV